MLFNKPAPEIVKIVSHQFSTFTENAEIEKCAEYTDHYIFAAIRNLIN